MKAAHSVLLLMILIGGSGLGNAQDSPAKLFVVHFKTGPNWDTTLSPNQQTNFGEHSANLNKLRQSGVIKFGARYGEYGMLFVNADTLEHANNLLEQDPGVTAGIFTFEVVPLNIFYPWQD